MAIAIRAVYEAGVFRPCEPVVLPERTEVEVFVTDRPQRDPDDPTGWKAIDGLIGVLEGTPPDVSEDHDRYLLDKLRR
jgi:hypothetical protein